MAHVPDIAQWLSGKNVLITGGTGFIGKTLLEKLLRSCPDIGTIYLLVREKKGQSTEERFKALKDGQLFKLLPLKYDWDKVVVVPADMSSARCIINDDFSKELMEKVNVVFHIAATIRFNETLSEAVRVNVGLTYDMVRLALKMKHLEAFVHVSTAYTNCDHLVTEEKVYPPLMDWKSLIGVAESEGETVLRSITNKLLDKHPNTYTFSKNLAEHVVWDHRHLLPAVIFRPVIVTALKKEPEAGWTDNYSGGEAMLILIGKGLTRAMFGDPDMKSFIVCPCDTTVNGIIAAAWKMACHSKITGEDYDGVITSIHWKQTPRQGYQMGKEIIKDHPLSNVLWTDYYIPFTSFNWFWLGHIFLNLIPTLIFQLIVTASGRNISLFKIQRKFYVTLDLLKEFSNVSFTFNHDNYMKLVDALSPRDRELFELIIFKEGGDSMENIIKLGRNGGRRAVQMLNEGEISKEEGLKQQKRLLAVDRVFRLTVLGLFLWLFPFKSVLRSVLQMTNFLIPEEYLPIELFD